MWIWFAHCIFTANHCWLKLVSFGRRDLSNWDTQSPGILRRASVVRNPGRVGQLVHRQSAASMGGSNDGPWCATAVGSCCWWCQVTEVPQKVIVNETFWPFLLEPSYQTWTSESERFMVTYFPLCVEYMCVWLHMSLYIGPAIWIYHHHHQLSLIIIRHCLNFI